MAGRHRRLTERQQLAELRKQGVDPPKGTPESFKVRANSQPMRIQQPTSESGRLRNAQESFKSVRGKKRSRVEKELAGLAPWAWDKQVEKHPPGQAAMEHFQEFPMPLVMSSKGKENESPVKGSRDTDFGTPARRNPSEETPPLRPRDGFNPSDGNEEATPRVPNFDDVMGLEPSSETPGTNCNMGQEKEGAHALKWTTKQEKAKALLGDAREVQRGPPAPPSHAFSERLWSGLCFLAYQDRHCSFP